LARIVIFGSSQPLPGERVYQEAYELGKLLTQSGHVVMTGGYVGVMEGASRGAAEAGGHVVGITCAEIEAWRNVRPNPWVAEVIRCDTLLQRLGVLIHTCEAAIVMPGGPGTLTEAALTWNLLLTEAISPRPLILVGPGWEQVIDVFLREFDGFIPSEQRKWLLFCNTVQEAVNKVDEIFTQ
jgi:hypothetical protein